MALLVCNYESAKMKQGRGTLKKKPQYTKQKTSNHQNQTPQKPHSSKNKNPNPKSN